MRKRDIDCLRLFGIFLLFPFHTARVFDFREGFYIHSNITSAAGVVFMNIISPWFMPLLFLVAGVSSYYALQKRDMSRFFKERVQRLLIPFILGVILIVPIQGYMARLQQGTLNGGYFNYLFTQFFTDFSDISGYRGTFTPAHLWFILFLFIISAVLLPLFCHIIKARKERGIGTFGSLFEKGWFLLLLFIPLTISQAFPNIGGQEIVFYGAYYSIGFFIASNSASAEVIDKFKWLWFGVMIISIPLYLITGAAAQGYGDFAWQSILFAHARNLYGINAILFMMGFAHKYLNRGGAVLNYLNQAAFPVYILHQSVMMVIAYYVLMLNTNITIQYIIIAFSTLAISIAIFEGARHIFILRVILGIKNVKTKQINIENTNQN